MNQKVFLNSISHGKEDIIQELLDLMRKLKIDYCIIGGVAVNAYVEPVVSLDLDLVVIIGAIDKLIENAKKTFKVETFEHSINLSTPKSDLRLQIQTDTRYQDFIKSASVKNVMGYRMKIAALKDVLQGKVWAYSDETRRGSKRQKDLADIMRIIESYPKFKSTLPASILKIISKTLS